MKLILHLISQHIICSISLSKSNWSKKSSSSFCSTVVCAQLCSPTACVYKFPQTTVFGQLVLSHLLKSFWQNSCVSRVPSPLRLLFFLFHWHIIITPRAISKVLQMSKYPVALTLWVSNNSRAEPGRKRTGRQVESRRLITALVPLLIQVLIVSAL